MASQAARKAADAAVSSARRGKKSRVQEKSPARAEDPIADAGAVSETLMIRRVWVRRDPR